MPWEPTQEEIELLRLNPRRRKLSGSATIGWLLLLLEVLLLLCCCFWCQFRLFNKLLSFYPQPPTFPIYLLIFHPSPHQKPTHPPTLQYYLFIFLHTHINPPLNPTTTPPPTPTTYHFYFTFSLLPPIHNHPSLNSLISFPQPHSFPTHPPRLTRPHKPRQHVLHELHRPGAHPHSTPARLLPG